MPISAEARHRLASLMEDRRRELRLRWQDVADNGRVSLKALHSARTGDAGIRPLTQRGIEDGLQWASGTVQRILDGDDPVPAETETATPALRAAPEPPENADRIAREAAALDLAMERVLGEVRERIRGAARGAAGSDVFPENATAALFFDQDLVPLDEREDAIAVILLKDRQRQWQRSG